MVVGYAAFNTQLSLKAKGNIKSKKASDMLKENVVDEGDGLYKDIYEDGRYFYKGTNPNNYITFNNETWRILSVETDGSLKIIRKQSIGVRVWDESGGENGSNEWDRPADIKTYLNGTYLPTITVDNDKIVSHTWSIGEVSSNNSDLADQINDENGTQSQFANVGMITASEYLRANTNIEYCENINMNNANNAICRTTNWIYNMGADIYTISPSNDNSNQIFSIWCTDFRPSGLMGDLSSVNANISGDIYPTLYLTKNITLKGEGTEKNPYIIEKQLRKILTVFKLLDNKQNYNYDQ